MSEKTKNLLEELEFVINLRADEMTEEALPWGNGAVAVKKALDNRHGSRNAASSVIARMGGLKDGNKKKIRDQVLALYRQEGASLKQMKKDKKSKNKSGILKTKVEKEKSPQEKSSKQTTQNKVETPKKHHQLSEPQTPKPHLERLLKKKRIHLSNNEQKVTIDTAKRIMPEVKTRVQTFSQKHPVLIASLRGAAISGVVGLATTAALAATGGTAAAVLPAIMSKGIMLAATSAGGGAKEGMLTYIKSRVNGQ
jgi:hypothetical protein